MQFSTWLRRLAQRRSSDPLDEPSDIHEEAAKVAVLEKAMKGRQRKRRGEERKGWRGVEKLGGEGGVSSYCASYYEVD